MTILRDTRGECKSSVVMEIFDLKFTFFHVLTFYKYITVMCVLAVLFIKADLNPNEVSSVAPHLSQTPVLS